MKILCKDLYVTYQTVHEGDVGKVFEDLEPGTEGVQTHHILP